MAPTNERPATNRDAMQEVPRTLFGYVERTLGDDGLDRLLALLGKEPGLDAFIARHPRFTNSEIRAMVDAAATVCGEHDMGRRLGQEAFWYNIERNSAEFIRTEGSIAGGMMMFARFSTKTTRTFTVREQGESHLVVEAVFADATRANRLACAFTAGYYAELPSVFQQLGSVVETACQLAGNPVCLFRLSWRPDPSRARVVIDVERSRAKGQSLIGRFEEIQTMASELLGAGDVDTVLERIIGRVSGALLAPRYLLVVKLNGEDRPSVHSIGFDPEDAEVAADQLLLGELAEEDGVLAVDVASKDTTYGRLAAFFRPGADFSESERRMLTAFAGHASAAIEVISSLEGARRDRDTSSALLQLSSSLARTGSVDDICARLARAVPAVVDADFASVWLFNAEQNCLELRAATDRTGEPLTPGVTRWDFETLPDLSQMAAAPSPFLFDSNHPRPALRALVTGFESAALVPIVSKGRFYGIVSAKFAKRVPADARPGVRTRLSGMADHAATAVENASLLERMRHEALHDMLTGLPNRALVEDRAVQALALAARSGRSVGLLFVDLDRFKTVDDTLGHAAGDELIRQVALRMRACARAADTLARVGGDEFVVVLPEIRGVDEVVPIAERMIHEVAKPFVVAGDELCISCSVGIAISPVDGTTYADLLVRGDAAMYTAKAKGRGAFALTDSATPAGAP